jgi:hypothetical protein
MESLVTSAFAHSLNAEGLESDLGLLSRFNRRCMARDRRHGVPVSQASKVWGSAKAKGADTMVPHLVHVQRPSIEGVDFGRDRILAHFPIPPHHGGLA